MVFLKEKRLPSTCATQKVKHELGDWKLAQLVSSRMHMYGVYRCALVIAGANGEGRVAHYVVCPNANRERIAGGIWI